MEHSLTVSTRVFIGYRRDDAAAEAARIASQLRAWFGETTVFFDTSSIEVGAQWPDAIERALETTRVMLALIGPDWLRVGANEWGQRRIDSESDWVQEGTRLLVWIGEQGSHSCASQGAMMPPASVPPARSSQAVLLQRAVPDGARR